jgi:hypothetical protein
LGEGEIESWQADLVKQAKNENETETKQEKIQGSIEDFSE